MMRNATPKDILGITLLAKRLHEESEYRDILFDYKTVAREVGKLFHPGAMVLIYEDENGVGAMLGAELKPYIFNQKKRAEDIAFYVAPEHRGKTIAYRMLKHFLNWADANEAVPVITMTSHINHETYEKLINRLGFRESGKQFILEV